MNFDRMNAAAELMLMVHERTYSFNLSSWRGGGDKDPGEANTVSRLHRCGNTACFGGWLAVSNDFIDAGGYADNRFGFPMIGPAHGYAAIANYLDISQRKAWLLACPDESVVSYGKPSHEVTALDVAEGLHRLMVEELARMKA
jgi:hypothetical protein